ncbi:carboxylating nicotinate-nucleotide diphosphorylase [Candidatus Persebacteraceae bacterium Df01]|jgi:nicotinate-nucleotide pyrophosphorylase (carboxylating)|uniref:nicotinate-nucleotide diphosphorylase (carboxylating) n=1 Tax=Candidatus Doriopsillibacter californiensis TaxID=2970740 RepID=A0ABT7QJN7_9GAMM|nr:carboxylating nicotinate-nucleotide diphosphorylase [Candidatus Persebacteraceae bacterium Df01]
MGAFDISLSEQVTVDVVAALKEDVGSGDISAPLALENERRCGVLYARQEAVFCGQSWFEACFCQLDDKAIFDWRLQDGEQLSSDIVVCEVQAQIRALLAAERSALNFVQTLSATATLTHRWQALVGDVVITDTRKTLPGLRVAQKYAVRVGSGTNHRMGLFDEILIKENHIAAAGGIKAALTKACTLTDIKNIQIEVRSLADLDIALAAGARRVLLDNFSLPLLKDAVQRCSGQAELEASGNVTEDKLAAIAATGVHRISVGALTKNVQAVDFSFLIN